MKIAIPSSDKSIEAELDDRFGRCPYFCFYDQKKGTTEFKENKLKDGSGGIGPQVAEFLGEHKIDILYTREVGPKAADVLNKLGIKISSVNTNSTIKEIIETIH
ncbi:MAG: NifB/NifX family molybdenum-iron cluster-binding protein [Bacteroidales bacterium]|nr:NifB/NifX family molybdenum-iron cluster-binding protein [Bacteroidales bacterium]